MKAYDTVAAALSLTGFIVLGWVSAFGVSDYHQGPAEMETELATAARTALKQAGHDWAEVEFSGQRAIVFGTPFSEAAKQEAVAAVQTSSGRGGWLWGGVTVVDTAFAKVIDIPEVTPFTWRVEKSLAGTLTLSGFVPNERAREALIARANGLAGGLVIDEMKLGRGVLEPDWLDQARFAMDQAILLRTAKVDLAGVDLRVSGFAEDDPGHLRVRAELAQLPAPWTGTAEFDRLVLSSEADLIDAALIALEQRGDDALAASVDMQTE